MRTTNVLFISTPRITGGAEISMLTAVMALDPGRYRGLVATSPDSMLIGMAHASAVPVYVCDFHWFSRRRPWAYASSIRCLYGLIRANDVSLVHTNCDLSLRYIRHVCNLARVPYVSHVRDAVREWFVEPYLRSLRGAQRVFVASHWMADLCERKGLDLSRVVVLANPIDGEKYGMPGPSLHSELGLDKTGVVVGIVGQVQEIKGHREFVEAALRICELDRDVMFLVVGQPPDDQSAAFQEALKLSIRTAGHVSRFFFLGHRDDVAAVMRTLDVLVVPSYSESFGRVVVEAMAAGDAVVCSDAGALPELVTDGENGLLVRTGDVDGLLQTLLTMIRNRELRERLGRSARASAQKFAVEQHVDTLQHVYDDVLASCHGARR